MDADKLRKSDVTRIGLALLYCGALFVSDLFTSVDLNESQLYPLAFLIIYRVRAPLIYTGITLVALVLTVTGFVLDHPHHLFDDSANRVFSVVVIIVIALGVAQISRMEQRCLRLSVTDSLTGTFNRRHFMELSYRENSRAVRQGTPIAVLMLDIDHFKKINDSFGHPIGDEAIRALAQTCTKNLRPNDILARFGGEEFVVTLPDTTAEGAAVVAERIRAAVEAISLPAAKARVRFTVSIGVSGQEGPGDIEQLIERADKALYEAKHAGRNRVAVGPTLMAA